MMRLLTPILVGLTLFFTAVQSAVAQYDLDSLEIGQRLRITSDIQSQGTIATFEQFRGDTLYVADRFGDVLRMPVYRIERLEVAHSDSFTGAAVGAGIGALTFTAALAIWGNQQGGFMCCGGFADDLGFAALIGIPLGGLAGGVAGGFLGWGSWVPVSLIH